MNVAGFRGASIFGAIGDDATDPTADDTGAGGGSLFDSVGTYDAPKPSLDTTPFDSSAYLTPAIPPPPPAPTAPVTTATLPTSSGVRSTDGWAVAGNGAMMGPPRPPAQGGGHWGVMGLVGLLGVGIAGVFVASRKRAHS